MAWSGPASLLSLPRSKDHDLHCPLSSCLWDSEPVTAPQLCCRGSAGQLLKMSLCHGTSPAPETFQKLGLGWLVPPSGPGLKHLFKPSVPSPPRALPLILSTNNCPEISRHQAQVTQQTLAQPYPNYKFRLHHAGPSFNHPHPSRNLSTCSLRLHIAWVTPCLEPQ